MHDDRRLGLTSAPLRWRPTPTGFYLGLAILTLSLAGLSLLAPSTPSYDPWSWLVWGREIIHGGLVITDTGTSWKPLPMLFTIPFALLGRSAAPQLWLVVARAGAIAAVLLAGHLAYRLTRALDASPPRSALARAPAVLAGLIAIVGLGFAARGSYITSNGLGYSEALATALALVAIECHLDGRPGAAFLAGFLVALDRPEVWLFWCPYGLWLGRRDPRMRAWITVAFVLQPVAWFLPVYLGSGHFGSSVTRATHPRANSLAHAADPFTAELSRAALPIVMLRIKLMAGLVVLASALAVGRTRRAGGPAVAGRGYLPALGVAAVLGLGGLGWFVLISVMTQIGFSGNGRYLVLGAALIDVCGAVGFGALSLMLARTLARAVAWTGTGTGTGTGTEATGSRREPRARWRGGFTAIIATGLAAVVFSLVPGWIQTVDFVSLPRVHRALLYQAHLRERLPRAIALAGGRARLLACGRVMTEGFQVPMVAYALGVPTTRILAPPGSRTTPGPAANVILQTRATQSSARLPMVRDWRPLLYTYQGRAGPWRTFTRCAIGS